MDEFRSNFRGTDIQHLFEYNILFKLRRWFLLYLIRSTLGLCFHVADFPILNIQSGKKPNPWKQPNPI